MGLSPHSALPPGGSNSKTEASLGLAGFASERQALERLIASGEFHRSPNLEKILNYLCQQYFLGKGNLVKEYSVATEALDRREDFDPKRDSIVRVEMHRLRRRLKEYYAGRGAGDPVRITLPDKSYVPEFVLASAELSVVAEMEQAVEPDSVWIQVKRRQANLNPILIAIGVVVALVAGVIWWSVYKAPVAEVAEVSRASSSTTAELVSASELRTQPGVPNGMEYRILAGRPKGRYPDRYGVVWQGDDFFTGGKAESVETEIRARGFDTNLFANKREGDFTYDIPLNPGVYEVTLLFAETAYGEGNVFGGGESTRQFHVHINGRAELSNFDVLGDAHDPNTATVKVFKDVRPAKDGKLHLRFEPSLVGKAFVNAIQIRPGIEGKIRPIRIVCRPHPYRDLHNEMWEADHYYRGGMQITRPTGGPVKDPDLFRGERYGKFSYSIPVPPGKYQARMFFVEYWWGPDRPGGGGAGSRVFDVFCNFKQLIRGLDIFKQSPKDRVIVETFHGLEPNLDSKLVFDFEPRANYALLNAIEIADDAAVLPVH